MILILILILIIMIIIPMIVIIMIVFLLSLLFLKNEFYLSIKNGKDIIVKRQCRENK